MRKHTQHFIIRRTPIANEFFTKSNIPPFNTPGISGDLRNEFSLVQNAFDKMPALAANPSLPIFVNAGGTVLEAVSAASARTKLGSTTVGDAVFIAASAAAARTAIGTVIGTDVQAFDATLLSIAALGTVADRIAYTTGVDTWAETPLTAFGRTLIDDTTEVIARQTLLLDKHGADIASAATINLDTSTGDLIDITGTTTITAITLAEGVEKTVRFTGILTLTNGASLVLPGAANIITAVGDFAVFRGYAAGVVRCVGYAKTTALSLIQIVKRKTADESVTSSITLQDDDHLTFAIAANEEWVVDFYVDVGNSLFTTGIKVSVTSPAGATQNIVATIITADFVGASVNAAAQRTTISGTALPFSAANMASAGDGFIHISYWVLNGATPGNITFQFAQDTSSATAITARKGSHMLATKAA